MKTLKSILMSKNPGHQLRAMFADGSLRALEPTLSDLRMEIPQGYHHKDNFEHSIVVLENAIKHEAGVPDLTLRTAALFHDIGKPDTREFSETSKDVTFQMHEVVGARLARKALKEHGYTRLEIQNISNLITHHMRAHGFDNSLWTDSAVRRLIVDAGSEKQLERLIIIFYSDLTTKNASLRGKVTRAIDSLKEQAEKVKAKDARKAIRPALDGHDLMKAYGLKQGRQLGDIMRFLNTDEGVKFTAEEAHAAIQEKFQDLIIQ